MIRKAPVQAASELLLIRPGIFYSNPETGIDNKFQRLDSLLPPLEIQRRVASEFNSFKTMLEEAGVKVKVFEMPLGEGSPDAIFPNNWFSTHDDGRLVLYPLFSPLRRTERRVEIVEYLKS